MTRFRLAAAACLTVTILAACHKPEPLPVTPPGPTVEGDVIEFPKDSAQLAALRTAIATAERETRVRINGRTAWDETQTTRITSPLGGRVSAVLASPGVSVRRGQALAVISSPEFGQVQTEARKAESDLIFVERNLARARELHQAGVIALKELQAAENESARARAERERTVVKEKLYGGAGVIDQQYKLLAPIDGVVVQRQVAVGQEVRADQSIEQPLFVISNPARLWVLLDVPEVMSREVQMGEVIRMTASALPGKDFSAKVDYIADYIDSQARTIRARGAIDNRDRLLKAEMYITAELEIPPTTLLKVPSTAVYLVADTHYAFVETAPGRYMRRALSAEEGPLGSMRIAKGLSAGDKVVADGALLLQQLLNQKATAPRKPAAQAAR